MNQHQIKNFAWRKCFLKLEKFLDLDKDQIKDSKQA